MQTKLLRVLQEREIQRVGSDQVLQVDVRIVTATNRDLQADAADGRFREDLFYRLNVMQLKVPPLRERRDDIPLLAHYFLEKYAAKNRKSAKGFSPLAMDMLIKYNWPGNLRLRLLVLTCICDIRNLCIVSECPSSYFLSLEGQRRMGF